MIKFLVVIVCVAFHPSFASAAALNVECRGDSLRLDIRIHGTIPQHEGRTVNVRASVVGSCDPAIVVNTVPISWPPFATNSDVTLMVPALSQDRFMYLELFGVDVDGSEFVLSDSVDGMHFNILDCSGSSIFGRGQLIEWMGAYDWRPCPGACWVWRWPVFTEADPGWEAYANSDQVVNFYGRMVVESTPPFAYLLVSRVVPEPNASGCGAVAIEESSWGALKSSYR